MDLEPNSDEQQVIDAAASFLAKSLPISRLRAANEGRFDPALRARLAELGWYGLGLPEEKGGHGFTIVDETLVFREIGRSLGPNAALGIALAARTAAEAGDEALTARLVAGELSVGIALTDPNRPEALIVDAGGAELALALSGGEARLIELGRADLAPLPSLDKSVSMARGRLDNLPVAARCAGDGIDRAGRLLTAAMLVGISEAVTAMITDYAKIRETFGRPIGAYQAVRHPCADMAVRTFATRAQLFLASVSVRDGRADADLQVDAAKALANEAALLNVDQNIQLHGGIATTDEHDAHLFMKRANLLVRLFGGRALLDRLLHTPMAA